MWTAEEVKAKLPNIRVRLPDGTLVSGRVCPGYASRFALVQIELHGLHVAHTVAWGTVTHCLNEDHPVDF